MLVFFASYFIRNEFKELIFNPGRYLMSIWNYIDLVPPLGIYILVVLDLILETDVRLIKGLQSTITFFMWLKFLYFFRIFKNTGYLIRMIV